MKKVILLASFLMALPAAQAGAAVADHINLCFEGIVRDFHNTLATIGLDCADDEFRPAKESELSYVIETGTDMIKKRYTRPIHIFYGDGENKKCEDALNEAMKRNEQWAVAKNVGTVVVSMREERCMRFNKHKVSVRTTIFKNTSAGLSREKIKEASPRAFKRWRERAPKVRATRRSIRRALRFETI